MKKQYILIALLFCSGFLFAQKNNYCIDSLINRQVLKLENPDFSQPEIFSDMGAWFGFGFIKENEAGFAGPYLLTENNGIWFHKKFLPLLFETTKGQKISMSCNNKATPGSLHQFYENDNTYISVNLIFYDKNRVLIRVDCKSTVNQIVRIKIPLTKGGVVTKNEVHYQRKNDRFRIVFDKAFNLNSGYATMIAEMDKKNIQSFFIETSIQNHKEEILPLLNKHEKEIAFIDNKIRWKQYLKATIQMTPEHALLYTKSVMTLITNWRSARGELKHDGCFPSYAYKGFHGFWAWDSWKHAAALAKIHPELAKNQIRAMFDYQNKEGMIADCIFRDTMVEKHNWRNTKPPLAAWAVNEILIQQADTAFAVEILPKLIKYHEWWYQYRDYNHNKMCEYGSTDGSLEAAAWESGMDNAVRFDSSRMIKSTQKSWSLNQESVDLNAFLTAEKLYISHIAGIAGDYAIEHEYGILYAQSIDKIRSHFYNEEAGYFFDMNTITGKHIRVFGPEAWIVLWAGLASTDEAYAVMKIINNEEHFNTFVPFPSLSAKHPLFNPEKGYWRGPVWFDQAWFAIEGLKRYQYNDIAREMTDKLLQNSNGLLNDESPIHENYHPLSGKALNAPHFSWSAAHLILLLSN